MFCSHNATMRSKTWVVSSQKKKIRPLDSSGISVGRNVPMKWGLDPLGRHFLTHTTHASLTRIVRLSLAKSCAAAP